MLERLSKHRGLEFGTPGMGDVKKLALFGCSLLALGTGISSAAYAQIAAGATAQDTTQGSTTADSTPQTSANGPETGDIIVTAQRREQSLLKVPVSISAISGTALQKAGITEATELVHSVPNLNISGGYGRAQPNFYIRGIGAEVARELHRRGARLPAEQEGILLMKA